MRFFLVLTLLGSHAAVFFLGMWVERVRAGRNGNGGNGNGAGESMRVAAL